MQAIFRPLPHLSELVALFIRRAEIKGPECVLTCQCYQSVMRKGEKFTPHARAGITCARVTAIRKGKARNISSHNRGPVLLGKAIAGQKRAHTLRPDLSSDLPRSGLPSRK